MPEIAFGSAMSHSETHTTGPTSEIEAECEQGVQINLEQRLREHLNQRKGADPAAKVCLEKGALRNTSPLAEVEYDKVEQLIDQVEPVPKYCFRNSQCGILCLRDDSLAYVEGFTMSQEVPFPVQHAWVEVNGKVAEITIPHLSVSPNDAVYFGVEYGLEMLKHVREEGQLGYPVAGSLNQRKRVGEFRE